MDESFYKQKFQEAVDAISGREFKDAGLTLSVETILESVALKIYKPEWSSNAESPVDASGRIFFSVWVNDKAIKEEKLYYNIHALKLRNLKGYKISSRSFAEEFRTQFEKHRKNWGNVDIQYGPLTLMQGWLTLNPDHIKNDIRSLADQFLRISPVIDQVLSNYQLKP